MGIVADDIVIMFAVFYANSGTVPTDIDFTGSLTGAPAGWTWTKTLVTIKDSGGTAKGVAGWAWARATGSFNGSCGSITGNGTAGASSGALMQSVKIGGCVTGEDPYEDAQSNNPNYTATVDWPAADMQRSTTGLSLIALLNSDNVNIGTPSSWTTLTSNASTQGSDSGLDIDYRAPGATGTYDPANGSMGANNQFGWATFHIVLTDTSAAVVEDLAASPAGVATVTAALSEVVQLAASVAGVAAVSANIAEYVQLASSCAGVATLAADLSGTEAGVESLAATTAGVATVSADLSLFDTLAAAPAGVATCTAGLSITSTLSCTVQGVAVVLADMTLRETLAANVAGVATISAELSGTADAIILRRLRMLVFSGE